MRLIEEIWFLGFGVLTASEEGGSMEGMLAPAENIYSTTPAF